MDAKTQPKTGVKEAYRGVPSSHFLLQKTFRLEARLLG